MSDDIDQNQRPNHDCWADLGGDVGITSFELNDNERRAIRKFVEEHAVLPTQLGFAQQQFRISFTGTSIGTIISIKDLITGDEQAVTDLDKL